MKIRLRVVALITTLVIGLLNTSCVTQRKYPVFTMGQISQKAPIDAVVEEIDLYHPYLFGTDVEIFLRTVDGGYRMSLLFPSASKSEIDFARSLVEGRRYTFPQVYMDFARNQQTNPVKK